MTPQSKLKHTKSHKLRQTQLNTHTHTDSGSLKLSGSGKSSNIEYTVILIKDDSPSFHYFHYFTETHIPHLSTIPLCTTKPTENKKET